VGAGARGFRSLEQTQQLALLVGAHRFAGPDGGVTGERSGETMRRVAVDVGKLVATEAIEQLDDVARQVAVGDERIFGVMVESHLNPGRQDLVPGEPLAYGVSITDACIGWDDTGKALETLAAAVRARRLARSE